MEEGAVVDTAASVSDTGALDAYLDEQEKAAEDAAAGAGDAAALSAAASKEEEAAEVLGLPKERSRRLTVTEAEVNALLKTGKQRRWGEPHVVQPLIPQGVRTERRQRCVQFCCLSMPGVAFPFSVFLLVLFLCLAVMTVFMFPPMNDLPFVIGGAAVWAWGAWLAALWASFFLIKFIFNAIGLGLHRIRYRIFKAYFFLNDIWGVLGWFVWSSAALAISQLIISNGGSAEVVYYLERIIWTIWIISLLVLIVLVVVKILMSVMEKDALWQTVATYVWREEYLERLAILLGLIKKTELSNPVSIPVTLSLFSLRRRAADYNPKIDRPNEFLSWPRDNLDKIGISVPQILRCDLSDREDRVREARSSLRVVGHAFRDLPQGSRDHILEGDFVAAGLSPQEAASHMSLWDYDMDGRVTREDMRQVVAIIFEDRPTLQGILKSRQSMARILTTILTIIVAIIGFIVILGQFGVDLTAIFLPFLTAILGLTFIFGPTIRAAFEAFLGVFLIRPWNVGDEISFNGKGLKVAEIELLSTTGTDLDGHWHRVPNSKILTSSVTNLGRSKDQRIRIYFSLNRGATAATFDALAATMRAWVSEREATYHNFGIWVENGGFVKGSHGHEEMRQVTIGAQCYVRHVTATMRGKWRAAQGMFFLALRDAALNLGISFEGIPSGIKLVNAAEIGAPKDFQ